MTSLSLARFALGAVCLLYTAHGAAQSTRRGSIEDRRQLQLQSSVFGYAKQDTAAARGRETTTIQAGLASRLGLGVGFSLSDNLQVHFLGGFTFQSASASGGETRTAQYELTPSLRFVLNETSTSRVYLGFGVGMLASRMHMVDALKVKSRGIQVGGALGIYQFVYDRLSIDPGIELYYVNNRFEMSGPEIIGSNSSGDGFRLLVTLGLSGWFGGRDDEPRTSTSETASTVPRAAGALLYRGHLDGLVFELRGNPEVDGNTLRVTLSHLAGESSWEGCQAFLVSDRGKHALEADPLKTSGSSVGTLELLSAPEPVEVLRLWLAEHPHLRVCNDVFELPPKARDEIAPALTQFERVAEAAGTRVPSHAPEPEPTPEPPPEAAPPQPEPLPAVEPEAPPAVEPAPTLPTAP